MGAVSALTIIEKAMKELGVLGVGQSANDEMADDALLALNNMLESWSLENLMVQADVEEAKTLTSGQASYTVGDGGNWTPNRPTTIRDDAFIRDTGNIDYAVRVLTIDVYRDQTLKTNTGRPDFAVYVPEFPLAKIYFYPTPDSSTDVFHYRARCLLTSFAELATEVNFAPGYERAIITNLAIEIASANRKEPRPSLLAVAEASRRNIKRQNAQAVKPVKLTELASMFGGYGGRTIEEGPFD